LLLRSAEIKPIVL